MPLTFNEQGALLIEDTGGKTFIALTDTPLAYAGNANKLLFVNATPDAVEFASAAYWDEVNGRLGIGAGAASPGDVLHIQPASGASTNILLKNAGDVAARFRGDSDRLLSNQPVAAFDGFWDGNLVCVIAFQTGADTVNKDDGYISFFTSDGGSITEKVRIDTLGKTGFFQTSPARRIHAMDDSASTGVIIPIARLESQVSGGAGAAGHGPALEFTGETTTTEDQSMAEVAARWSVATHASRRARVEIRAAYIGTDVLVGVMEAPAQASADGNARGVGAVDLQGYRTLAAQVAAADYSVIGGGWRSEIASNSPGAVIAGGYDHSIGATSVYATISGGYDNLADNANYGAIPGGQGNTVSADHTWCGGENGTASHASSFVWSSAAATVSWAANTWTARCHGGARFYSAAGVATGVQLSSGGNAWAAISARAAKENFRPVDGTLSKIATLPVYNYNLKSQPESVRHIGPVAEDFNKIFGFTEATGYINTLDISGVALAAIQALLVRIEKLEERLQ